MRARPFTILMLLATSALAKRLPSEAVFPPQKMPLRFSHKQHLAFKLECDFCHDQVESSTSAKDDLIPAEDTCATCHKIDRKEPNRIAKPAARCDACHVAATEKGQPVVAPPVDVPTPNLKFNHKVHIDRKVACETCHGTMRDVDLASRAQLPNMPLCLGCHNKTVAVTTKANRAPAKCSTCHLTRVDGTLETTFASGQLVPSGVLFGDAHTPQFSQEHARLAAGNEAYCENCHRRDFCLSCHNGVTKPLSFHGNDYVSIHAVDARKNTIDCNGCHRRQTFCLGCHERTGVFERTTESPGVLSSQGKRFHPPYERWVSPPRTPEHHSWQAERNIRQCVSCHREDMCLDCHSTTPGRPFNVNPHPVGFANSRQCDALSSRNARVCLKCHGRSDPHLTCR